MSTLDGRVIAVAGAAGGLGPTVCRTLADSLSESGATANIVVVNAILTPAMRAENPDKPYKTFTSVEDIAGAIAFVLSDAAQKMNGARLELHP